MKPGKDILIKGFLTFLLFSFLFIEFMVIPMTTHQAMAIQMTTDQTFLLEIKGYRGSEFFIPLPAPPDYNDTLVPADVIAYKELVFRLTYYGFSPITINQLEIWQTIKTYETYWNITYILIEELSKYTFDSFGFLDFSVKTDIYFIRGGNCTLSISIINHEYYFLNVLISRNLTQVDNNLNHVTTSTETATTYDTTIGTIFVGVFLLIRRKKRD